MSVCRMHTLLLRFFGWKNSDIVSPPTCSFIRNKSSFPMLCTFRFFDLKPPSFSLRTNEHNTHMIRATCKFDDHNWLVGGRAQAD